MENKKKAKGTVLSLVLSILLVLNLVVCGVAIALSVANVTLGGSITFNAKHVNATISAGQVTGGTLNGTNKMQAITLDATHDGATEIATWSGLDLEFNESGDDVTISFTITNNSEEFDLKSALSITNGTQTNATMTVAATKNGSAVDASSVVIDKKSGENTTSVVYTITFHVTDKDKSASISDFALKFDLEKTDPIVYHTITLNSGYTENNAYPAGASYQANILYYAVDGNLQATQYTSGTEIKAYSKIWISTCNKEPDWRLIDNTLYGDQENAGQYTNCQLQVNNKILYTRVINSGSGDKEFWGIVTISEDCTISLAYAQDGPM